MPTTESFLAALILAIVTSASGSGGQDPGAYLAEKDGRKVLKEPLTLRDEQKGVAGTTGTVWTVEPSGQWRVERFVDRGGTERRTAQRSGSLTPAQLEELARALADRDLAELPEKTGRDPKVNSHRVILKFGRTSATLLGVPPRRDLTVSESIRKGAPAKSQPDASVWERFAHLAQAVETSCKAAPPQP